MNRKYPLKPQVKDERDFKFSVAKAVEVPDKVDFTRYCPAIYDQLTFGSCTSNMWLAMFKMYLKSIGVEVTEDFSRMFHYNMELQLEGNKGQDDGAQMRTGGKVLNKYGVCHEQFMTYIAKNFGTDPSTAAVADALKHTIPAYKSIDSTVAAIEQYLAAQQIAGKPRAVGIGIKVFDSFESDQVKATGIIPMPTKKESCLGGHAIYIPAFDKHFGETLKTGCFSSIADGLAEIIGSIFNLGSLSIQDDGYVKFGNSWNTNWGAYGGFGYLPFEYIEKYAYDFWVIEET